MPWTCHITVEKRIHLIFISHKMKNPPFNIHNIVQIIFLITQMAAVRYWKKNYKDISDVNNLFRGVCVISVDMKTYGIFGMLVRSIKILLNGKKMCVRTEINKKKMYRIALFKINKEKILSTFCLLLFLTE